ncbi:uncharacterized protein LOC141606862 isoform X2 [Silene latifolia]|uniref:uncharacterized protein LOC141606862 isoform X2 n=1 Tax=Silene latifolia TaxID=37657 RepID=UPI003D7799B3
MQLSSLAIYMGTKEEVEVMIHKFHDDISIPISAQIFDFCDDSDIFPDTLQNSEVTSSPNCCSYEDHNSSYDTNNIKFSTHHNLDINNFQGDQNGSNTSTTSSTTTTATTLTIPNHHRHHPSSGLSVIFDPQVEIDTDISASIDFSPPQLAYNFNPTTSLANHIAISNGMSPYSASALDPSCVPLPLMGGPGIGLGPVFEDDCLSSIPPYLRLNPLDPSSMSSFQHGSLNHGLCTDNSGLFGGNLLMAAELQSKELDFQGDNAGIYCTDQLVRYNSGDIQAFSNENSQLVSGATTSAPISTEITNLDDSPYKVGKLSVEQRKEKIHRYMKKRNERNFCKKIKYACRKTLADSRPRVRGRFAKNDEFGEGHKHINGHHDDDDYDEVTVKEGDDMVDSSDIFAHTSGVNSFKCNFQIQSWI